jgi:two-component system sensor histidine kinase DevS
MVNQRGAVRPFSEAGLTDEQIWRVVDGAPDSMILVDESGNMLLVNRQTEAMFGYERSELLGKPIEELVPERFRQAHGAHRTRYRAEPRPRPMGSALHLFGRHHDGHEFPIEVSLSPIEGEHGLLVVAAVRDISDRLAIEAEARRVQEIVNATRDGVFIFDPEKLHFSYVNQGALTQLGYSRDALLTMTPLHISPAFTQSQYRDLIAPLTLGEQTSITYTTVHRRYDGVDVPVEVLLQAQIDSADRLVFVTIVRDISERVQSEGRLRRAAQDVHLLKDRERIARDLHDVVIQRMFAAGMTLQATRTLITEPTAAGRVASVVDELDETIREIRTMIFGLQQNPSERGGLRSEIVRILAEETLVLGFEPRLHLDGPIDVTPDAIATHLVAVLREALSNVGRHADATSVDVSVHSGSAFVELCVVDNGVGIGKRRGTGNGLANMRERAGLLGGTLTLTTGRDGGTVLEWHVPIPSSP